MEEASICDKNNSQFHPGCSPIMLTHLCFVDDLLLFSVAKLQTIQCFKKVLAEFASMSGLNPNPSKSSFFFSGVSEGLRIKLWSVFK